IGFGAQRHFSVIGDAVNLAARLEDLSQPGEILVGSSTRDETEADFDFDVLGPRLVKGKENPVTAYRLLRAKPAKRSRTLFASPFVGRNPEMQALHELLLAAQGGQGSAVEIVGDAGVGKTRLIDEIRSRASDVRWIEVRGHEERQSTGFGLARKVVFDLVGVSRDDNPQMIRTAIHAALANDPVDADLAYLAAIAGLPRNESDHDAFEGRSEAALQLAYAAAFRRLLAAQATRSPLVLAWEDLHWADRSSLDLVRALALEGPVPGIFAIFSRRPDRDEAGAMRIPGAVPILLESLSANEAEALIAALLDPSLHDEKLRNLIIERVEGNPFFLEEMIRALGDDLGRNSADRGEVGTALTGQTQLPLTVQGVIMARLDRLYPEGRQALQTASVIGRAFQTTLLALVSVDEPSWHERLPEILQDLHERDFTRPNDKAITSYRFKHGLAQEVTYESLLHARRRVLHRSVANALIQQFGETENLAGTLAYHFERGDQPFEASVQLIRAGTAARRAHANAEALDHFRRAAELLLTVGRSSQTDDLLCASHGGAGDMLLLAGRYGEAQLHFASALSLLSEDAHVERASLLRRCGQARMLERDAESACTFYQSAIAALGKMTHDVDPLTQSEWIRANLDLLWPLYWRGELVEMQTAIDRVRPHVQRHGTPRQVARLFDREIMLRLQIEGSGVTAETVALAKQAAEAVENPGSLSARTLGRQTLGYCLMLNGQPQSAKSPLLEALALSRQSGNTDQETLALSNLSIACRMTSDTSGCVDYARQMLCIAEKTENRIQIGVAQANLAWAALRHNNNVEANVFAQSAVEHWKGRTFRMQWLGWWPVLSLAVMHKDQQKFLLASAMLLHGEQLQPPLEIAQKLHLLVMQFSDQPRTDWIIEANILIEYASANGLT
ncbi:adenylate/guanylate cyclase domain-containing protein, partial [Novosphingobium sp.]|uniref:ATP-binding protein n=1 Tax=Novosphingobium sp. TaxID=1874826 RepID=UPI0025D21DD2